MTKPYQHWKVRPHGKLSKIDEGILTITGPIRMPLGRFPRRMTLVRLSDSRLGTPRTALSILRPRLASLTRLE